MLAPPIDGDQASLLALLADGAAWSTSALALALGESQRTVQRALAELEAAGRVRSIGAGAGAALAGAAAGRIHDDLVTPRRAAARRRLARTAPITAHMQNKESGHDPARQPTTGNMPKPPARAAEIVREYGPFPGADKVGGVSHDGRNVWAATGATLIAFDPESGETTRTLEHAGDAGTAFDGTHLYQIAEARIDKIDPATGKVLASIPAPGHGRDSGLAWAEGSLWVGQYRDARSTRSTPRPAPSCARSSRTASSPA